MNDRPRFLPFRPNLEERIGKKMERETLILVGRKEEMGNEMIKEDVKKELEKKHM